MFDSFLNIMVDFQQNHISPKPSEKGELMVLDNFFLRLSSLSPFRFTATKCGHRTKRCGAVSAFGRSIIVKMPVREDGSVDYCLDCIGKMAIRCAWCGNPIFIDDSVTLYTPRGDFQVPDHATVYREKPLQLVGCLGWNCADSGADRAGFWMPGENGKGCVQRMETPHEMILRATG